MGKIKTIYMPWLAIELRNRGFKIVGVKPNPKKPHYDCYDFENTEEFNKIFTELTHQKKEANTNEK